MFIQKYYKSLKYPAYTVIDGNNSTVLACWEPTVTDLINRIVQVLRGDLYWFKISTWDAGLMEPVEP